MVRPAPPAFEAALAALARVPRSTRELARWLAQRAYAEDDVRAALERLVAVGLLDDYRFAVAFARTRATERGMSRRRIEAELARRGVARGLVDRAVAEVIADEGIDEREQVVRAARKKLRSLQRLEPDVRRRRLMAFLSRRGFPGDLVRDVVRELARG